MVFLILFNFFMFQNFSFRSVIRTVVCSDPGFVDAVKWERFKPFHGHLTDNWQMAQNLTDKYTKF